METIRLDNGCYKHIKYADLDDHDIWDEHEYFNSFGEFYRENDLPCREYYVDDVIDIEVWLDKVGRSHRVTNKAAYIEYGISGQIRGIVFEEFYIHGIEYTEDEYTREINIINRKKILKRLEEDGKKSN